MILCIINPVNDLKNLRTLLYSAFFVILKYSMSTEFSFKSDTADTAALLEEFFEAFPAYQTEDKARIKNAWDFLCLKCGTENCACGRPYYLHPLRTAFILAQNTLDSDCICAGLLHDVYNHGVTEDEVRKKFGDAVAKIVRDNSRIMRLPINTKTLQQADAIRKMLFAMVDDVRVIFVKLADRLDRIRNIKTLPSEEQTALAQEVIDIWAPLADRLGMSAEKNEFEDLSLKYTNPDAFQQIKAVVAQKKEERAATLEKATQAILKEAEKAGIKISIKSRAKHFYSIYQKMRKRNKEAGELFDLLALRAICRTNAECYTLIGIVHGLWKPLDGRFKDYIAMPKSNGYQSLHTTVMCGDKPLEIQIRTQKMHDVAEHGIAAHWLYKKGLTHDLVDVNNLSIFNQLRELRSKDITDDRFFQEFKNDLLGDKIVVFTPNGDVKQLPVNSTAIDFAYAVHSAIGEKIVGAKADGKIIPITQPLANTQIIEILTNPQAHPTETQLKYARTSKARQKIHAWLTNNDPNFSDKVTAEKGIAQKAREEKLSARSERGEKRAHKKGKGAEDIIHETGKVKILNTTNFMLTFAKCCAPKFKDPIVGYVSRGRGVIIHRADCRIFQKIPDIEHRTIAAEWDNVDIAGHESEY